MQEQLFDPFGEDRARAEVRRRARITPQQAEQMVLELVTRAGGSLRGDRLLAAGFELGLDTDAVAHAVHVLTGRRRVTATGNTVALVRVA